MYIVFEGLDGVGKSTQIELLKPCFKEAIFSFEPGATALGVHLRKLLLESREDLSKRAELLLFLADRAQHCARVLKPNLSKLIISDRSLISGIAYARASKEFNLTELLELNSFAMSGIMPEKCVFLKADEALLKERFEKKSLDTIEQRGLEYFLGVQAAFEECLSYMQEHLNLKVLSLNAREKKEILHQSIKGFIND